MIRLALAAAADVDDFVALATEMDVFYADVRPDPPQQRAAEVSAVLFSFPPAAFTQRDVILGMDMAVPYAGG